MTETKTLELPAAVYDRHDKRREQMGLTWPEYLERQAPDWVRQVEDAACGSSTRPRQLGRSEPGFGGRSGNILSEA